MLIIDFCLFVMLLCFPVWYTDWLLFVRRGCLCCNSVASAVLFDVKCLLVV